eukprot:1436678-Amphidinium_carterae.3
MFRDMDESSTMSDGHQRYRISWLPSHSFACALRPSLPDVGEGSRSTPRASCPGRLCTWDPCTLERSSSQKERMCVQMAVCSMRQVLHEPLTSIIHKLGNTDNRPKR